jgi:hypothetical protein
LGRRIAFGAGGGVLALVTSVPHAWAGVEDRVTLGWDAPEGCPDAAFVLARVEQLADEGSTPDVPIRVTARIERVGTGFRLSLEMKERASRWDQEFEDPSCAQLAETASVVIALAVGREHSNSEEPEPGAPSGSGPDRQDTATNPGAEPVLPTWGPKMKPSTRRTLAPGPRTTPALPPQRQKPGSTAGLVQVGVIGDLGALPAPAAGLQLGAAIEGRKGWSGLLSVAFLPKTRSTSDEAAKAGGKFRLTTATVAGCQATDTTPASLQLCLGVELGQLRAWGVDGAWSNLREHLWLAPRADVGVEVRQGLASAVVSLGAVVPLVRKEYVMENAGPIHQPNWLTGRLGVAARQRF